MGLSLAIMGFFAIFVLVAGARLTASFNFFGGNVGGSLDGSSASGGIDLGFLKFDFNPITGAILILLLLLVLAVLVGLKFAGFGLSDESVRIIINVVVYGGIWGALSLLGYGAINAIPFFGGFIYIILTIMYVLGVQQRVANK